MKFLTTLCAVSALAMSLSACEYVVFVSDCTDSDTDTSGSTDEDDSTSTGSTSTGNASTATSVTGSTDAGSGSTGPDLSMVARVGDLRAAGIAWRGSHYLPCTETAHVLCVQYSVVDPEFRDRFVFVTERVSGFEIGGVEGAFARCQNDAEAAGLPGYFVPFLGFPELVPALWSTIGYGDPINDLADGGYYRVTGEIIDYPGRNLFEPLKIPIDRFADGTDLPAGPAPVWTALDDDLWIDIDPAVDVTELSLEEQEYYVLGRTCMGWSRGDIAPGD